jgi:hypothetical protein
MKSLQVLLLSDNKLQGLPLAIGRMKDLKILEVVRNPMVFPSARAFFDLHLGQVYQYRPLHRVVYTVRLKAYLKCCPANDVTVTSGIISYS